MEPYKLINVLHAHDGPVRCIAIGSDGKIVTGCQSDSPCVRSWSIKENSVEEVGVPLYHDHWVTAVTILSPNQQRTFNTEGCVITGCMDNKIRVFSNTGALMNTLEGHTKGIISFSWTTSGYLLSGSWDGSALVWDLNSNSVVQRLQPHENGVHVLGLSNSTVATTSTGESVDGKPANFKLRLWDVASGTLIGLPIADHAGSIRSIAAVPGINGFMTTANDGTVALRSIDGETMGTMYHAPQEDGSAPFILDCCALSAVPDDGNMDVVSCGEDGSVMVWNGTDPVQSIPHPTSVWCVVATGNGDFATAGHDGVVRFFSRRAEGGTAAAGQMQADFLAEVAEAQQKRRKGPSSEELAKAAPWESRGQHPGKSENQVMVFNRDGAMIAAQWNSGAWVVIGEVTGSGDGGSIDGVWFDHVMPVEIETPNGLRTLKLGHNNGENPFVAAQRFVDQHQLGQAYLGQIADWITSRAGHNTPTLGAAPGAAAGGSRLNQRTSTAYPAPVRSPAFSFKVVAPGTFEDIPVAAKLFAKVVELNAVAAPSAQLSERDVQLVYSSLTILCDTSHYHSSVISSEQVRAVAKMALAWDVANVFPSYDILRLVAVHPAGAEALASVLVGGSTLLNSTLELLSRGGDVIAPHTAALTATRFLCNAFKHNGLRNLLVTRFGNNLVAVVGTQGGHSNKLVRVAASTLAMNLAAAVSSTFGEGVRDSKRAVLAASCELVRCERDSNEVVLRALRAIGTICAAGGDKCDVSVAELLAQVSAQWTADRLGETAVQCLQEVVVLVGSS